MIARTVRWEQHVFHVVFDRDAIVRAALRVYVENILARVDPLDRLNFTTSDGVDWAGNLQRGAFFHDNGTCDRDVVAWTEAGVVGLAYELGWGPIEQLGLSMDEVTGGPDDVRAAVLGLPAELEPAFEMAVGMLDVGPQHGEKWAGVGFWLYGDRLEGSLFEDSTAAGAPRLFVWGALQDGRLPHLCDAESVAEMAAENTRRGAAPIEALVDAVTARAFGGPTELTAEEIATLLPTPPVPEGLLYAQQCLQKVGITWPGSPELPPEEPPPPPRPPRNPSLARVTTTIRRSNLEGFDFSQSTIVYVALRTYVEAVFVKADPLKRYYFPPCAEPGWKGDFKQGAFYNGDGRGGYDVVAWSEAGVVGLAYEPGFGPIEQLGLPVEVVTGGPDDVRPAMTEMPSELESAFVMAAGMLRAGPQHGEKLAGVGFWLHEYHVGGSLFNKRSFVGSRRLRAWSLLRGYRLLVVSSPFSTLVYKEAERARRAEPPFREIVAEPSRRALKGPTELTTDELATLLPTPPDPAHLLGAQRMLQKVGITWPGSPELPEEPPPDPNPFL